MNKEQDDNKKNYIINESENYISAYFGRVPDQLASKPDKKNISQLIQLLSRDNARESRDEVLNVLKAPEAKILLMEALRDDEQEKNRLILLAACWETGHDFSDELKFFSRTAAEGSFEEAIEATSVIGEMQGPFDFDQLEESIQLLKSNNDEGRKALLDDSIQYLSSFLPQN